jgi:hypothetical protein
VVPRRRRVVVPSVRTVVGEASVSRMDIVLMR